MKTQNSSFSSNRKTQNSELSFQFVTSGRELTQKSMKPTNSSISSLRKTQNLDPAVYFVNENPRFGKIYAEKHKFQAFPENALIDPQCNMTKGSTFSFFHAICTN